MRTKLFLPVLAVVLSAAFTAPAARAEGALPNDLMQYDFEIELRAFNDALAAVDAMAYAEELKFNPPIYPPQLTKAQVEARIEEELQRVIDKEFPSSRYQEIKEEAEARYRLYEVGDEVKVRVMVRGQMQDVEGRLEVVTLDKVKISSVAHARQDIDAEHRPRFYRDEHEKAIERYKAVKTEVFETARDAKRAQEHRRIANEIWPEFGYVWLKSKPPRWESRDRIFTSRLYAKLAEHVETVRPEIAAAVYQENGFSFEQDTQRWMHTSDIVKPEKSMLDTVQEFFRRKLKEIENGGGGAEVAPEAVPVEEPQAPVEAVDANDLNDLWGDEEKPAPPKAAPPATPPAPVKKPVDDVSDLFDE